MMYAGDAIGHTQHGNNNAYCQDNPISWLNWNLKPQDRELLAFVQRMIKLRKNHPVFRRRHFFQGRPIKGADVKDILWLAPNGLEMSEDTWRDPSVHTLGMFLSGEGLNETDQRGQPLSDDNFLVLLNAHHEDINFTLPALRSASSWIGYMDTSREGGLRPLGHYEAGGQYPLQARSIVVLIEPRLNGKTDPKEDSHEAPP
jgi:glycogen operon protein